jgi:hypothetical protein
MPRGGANRKLCERAEKRADWLGLQAGLASYGRRERRPRPAILRPFPNFATGPLLLVSLGGFGLRKL